MPKQSRGFSLPLLVTAMFVVLVGGFIAWRLFAPKTSSQIAPPQAKPSNSQAQTTSDPNAGYVVLKEWGVRFKPASNLGDIQYTIGNRTPNVDGTAVFSTSVLSAYSNSCSAKQNSKAPLGILTRTKAAKQEFTSESGAFVKKIGDYYYQYVTPQSACAEDAANLPAVPLAEFKSSIGTLEAAK